MLYTYGTNVTAHADSSGSILTLTKVTLYGFRSLKLWYIFNPEMMSF